MRRTEPKLESIERGYAGAESKENENDPKDLRAESVDLQGIVA
jgi:hypothetical protein